MIACALVVTPRPCQVPCPCVPCDLQRHHGVHVWVLLWKDAAHLHLAQEDVGGEHVGKVYARVCVCVCV